MNTDCCYALQDKVWVRDPDGNEWEVFVVLKDNLPEKARAGTHLLRPDLLRSQPIRQPAEAPCSTL